MLGVDDAVPPGPLKARMSVRIAAKGADPAELESIVAWGVAHSPIADALRRAVPTELETTIC
jgi:hypothetical protein